VSPEERAEHEVSMLRDKAETLRSTAAAKRETAVATFFDAATELLRLCVPLVKASVEDEARRRKERR